MKNAITCEDAGMLTSRNLDRDLSRAEVACLYVHLSSCASCRVWAAEMARLENGAADIAKSYKGYFLKEGFAARVQDLVRSMKPLWHPSGLAAGIRAFFTSRTFAALAGGALSLFLFFIFLEPDDGQEEKRRPRFLLHPISFHAPSDTLTWHHDEALAPGDSLHITIVKGHENSYHLRLESSGSAEVEIVHQMPGAENTVQKTVFRGIKYGSLQSPRTGDNITIRNLGRTPVSIKAHTVERGNVMTRKKRQSSVL